MRSKVSRDFVGDLFKCKKERSPSPLGKSDRRFYIMSGGIVIILLSDRAFRQKCPMPVQDLVVFAIFPSNPKLDEYAGLVVLGVK